MTATSRTHVVVAAIYAALTAVQGRAVIQHLASSVPHDAADPVLNASILAWNATHVPLTSAWWNFPGFYPTESALTLSEHLTGLSIFAAPLVWVTGNPALVYNVLFLLSFFFCALAAYALAYRLTGNLAAAFLAGLAFGFAPYRAAQLSHLQMLSSYWIPVALLGLHAYVETRRARWLALAAAAWLLQGLTNSYYLIYFTLFIALWIGWFLVLGRRSRELFFALAAFGLAALVAMPIVLHYVAVHDALGLTRRADEIAHFSGDVLAVATAPSDLAFWGSLKDPQGIEGQLFPGLTLILLLTVGEVLSCRVAIREDRSPIWQRRLRALLFGGAVLALGIAAGVAIAGRLRIDLGFATLSATRLPRPLLIGSVLLIGAWSMTSAVRSLSHRAFYALGAVVTWLLTLGPSPTLSGTPLMIDGPYALLLRVPGVDGARVPTRFWMITALCLAVLVALLFTRAFGHLRPRVQLLIAAAAAVGMTADSWTTVPVVAAPQHLAALDAYGPRSNVLELPFGNVVGDSAAQYRAVMGRWRTFNGYSGYSPPQYLALAHAFDLRTDGVFDVLRSDGPVTVVIDTRRDALGRWPEYVQRQPGAALLASTDGLMTFGFPQGAALPRSRDGASLPIRSVLPSCFQADARFIIDSDLQSRWTCGAQDEDRDIVIELETESTVASLTQFLGPNRGDFPVDLQVETSRDGVTWEPGWRGPGALRALIGSLDDPKRLPVRVEFAPRTARFVRLRQLGRDNQYYWSIAELAVNAPG